MLNFKEQARFIAVKKSFLKSFICDGNKYELLEIKSDGNRAYNGGYVKCYKAYYKSKITENIHWFSCAYETLEEHVQSVKTLVEKGILIDVEF